MPIINQDLKLKNDPSTTVYPNINADSIPAGSITTAKLAAGAVATANIATGAITTVTINNAAITDAKLASFAVTTDKIAADAVTADKIPNGTITTAKIANSAVTGTKIANQTITNTNIANEGIIRDNLAAQSVGRRQFYFSTPDLSDVVAEFNTWNEFIDEFSDYDSTFFIHMCVDDADGIISQLLWCIDSVNRTLTISYFDPGTNAVVHYTFANASDVATFELNSKIKVYYVEG